MVKSESYRPGIGYIPAVDGLRAVAVVSVLLYHLNHGLVPGGYAGVDIFFVISGFVVTASLAHLKFDTFRGLLAQFYARRFLRILPALVVCLVCSTVAYAVLVPQSWLSNSNQKSAIAAFFGASNIVLAFNKDDYFSPVADFNPFIHTWSLGVEEQFYFVFPAILFLYVRAGASPHWRRTTAILATVLGLVSFAVCGVLAAQRWEYSFYLLPARFWELAIGMVLALSYDSWKARLKRIGRGKAHVIGGAGLALLAVALTLPQTAAFPFPLAALPCGGAALVIMAVCIRPESGLTRVLGSAPMVAIGLRSYSLYLWHWPIFVLLRWTIGLDHALIQVAAFAASAIAATLSYQFVETPFRRGAFVRGLPRGWVVAGGIVAALTLSVATREVFEHQSLVSLSVTARGDDWYTTRSAELAPGPDGCVLNQTEQFFAGGSVVTWKRSGCGDTMPPGRLFVSGNSHALAYTPMLRQFALDTGHEVRLYFKSGCALISLKEPLAASPECVPFFDRTLVDLRRELGPEDVLFLPSFRLAELRNQWGNVPAVEVDSTATIRKSVDEALSLTSELSARHAKIVFEAPKPVFTSPAYRCADVYTRPNPLCQDGLSVPRPVMEARRRNVLARMQYLASEQQAVTIWDPFPILCPGQTCSSFDQGRPLFFDNHHLSNYGNRALRSSFTRAMTVLFSAKR